jgi:hypothetical protein
MILHEIFYCVYKLNSRNNSDVAVAFGFLGLLMFEFINLFVLFGFVDTLGYIPDFIFKLKNRTVIPLILTGILVFNYFIIIHRARYKGIIKKYENKYVDDLKRLMSRFVIYIFFSFLLVFILLGSVAG